MTTDRWLKIKTSEGDLAEARKLLDEATKRFPLLSEVKNLDKDKPHGAAYRHLAPRLRQSCVV